VKEILVREDGEEEKEEENKESEEKEEEDIEYKESRWYAFDHYTLSNTENTTLSRNHWIV